ncbi:MAG: hypothetical protein K6F33_02835 [Bacteroidales bacterium]|nr:hypothetical protein [Bacteroidales bacterium]
MQLRKILSILTIVLFVITAIIMVMFYMQVVPLSGVTEQMEHGVTDMAMGWAYVLFGLCALLAVAFPIWEFVKQLIDNPKSVIKTVIIFAVIAVVFFIAYAIADGSIDSILPLADNNVPSEGELKWSGAGLNALYIILGLSVVAVIYAEVAKKLN